MHRENNKSDMKQTGIVMVAFFLLCLCAVASADIFTARTLNWSFLFSTACWGLRGRVRDIKNNRGTYSFE